MAIRGSQAWFEVWITAHFHGSPRQIRLSPWDLGTDKPHGRLPMGMAFAMVTAFSPTGVATGSKNRDGEKEGLQPVKRLQPLRWSHRFAGKFWSLEAPGRIDGGTKRGVTQST